MRRDFVFGARPFPDHKCRTKALVVVPNAKSTDHARPGHGLPTFDPQILHLAENLLSGGAAPETPIRGAPRIQNPASFS